MNFRRWILPRLDKEAAASLAEEAGLEPFLALMLSLRGMTDVEEALEFLSGWDVTADPLAFADMDKAAARVRRALDQGSGSWYTGITTPTASPPPSCCTRICGNRSRRPVYASRTGGEGYGLHKSSVDQIAEAGVKLIVTVDNGISAVEEIAYARKGGSTWWSPTTTSRRKPFRKPPRSWIPIGPTARANLRITPAWASRSNWSAPWKGMWRAFLSGMPIWWPWGRSRM